MGNFNPFDNINKVEVHIPLQKRDGGTIKKKKAGRPKTPNMKYFMFRVDKVLHAKLVEFARVKHTNKSSVLAQALKEYMNELNS